MIGLKAVPMRASRPECWRILMMTKAIRTFGIVELVAMPQP